MNKLKMEPPDLVQVNIEKLAALFPACVTEARGEDGRLKKTVSFELLRQMLSDVVLEGDEAYEFTWVGKKAAIVEANRPIRNTDSNGRFHSDWCSMIYSRLLLARNLLSDDGSIFISIDDHEADNLKKICDEVFCESCFVADISWQRTYSPRNDSQGISQEPKPLRLLDRILTIATDKDSIVLDFFSGSATTAYAVMKKNAVDDGLIESESQTTFEISIAQTVPSQLDIGFRVFKLGDSNITDVYYSAGEYDQGMLDQLVSNIKPDSSAKINVGEIFKMLAPDTRVKVL